MSTTIKNPVLQKISEIYEAADKCRLGNDIFYRRDNKLSFLAEKLEMSKIQKTSWR